MWWWEFNEEEPLQEDIVVYEKFIEMKKERDRMNQEKERQKAASRKGRKGGSSAMYSIPD